MEPIASSLQKAIQDNFRKLNIYGLASTPEVMCSCSVFNPTGGAQAPAMPPATNASVVIPSQFIPGEKNDGTLLTVDPGNHPFMLPQGMTPDDVILAQAAALAPIKEAAEKKAAAKAAATGAGVIVTESMPGGATAVAVAMPATSATTVVPTTMAPNSMGVQMANSGAPVITSPSVAPPVMPPVMTSPTITIPPTTVVTPIPPLVEKYAAFRYNLDDNVTSYRHSALVQQPYHEAAMRGQYVAGAQDMMGISLLSWCTYFICIAIVFFFFFF